MSQYGAAVARLFVAVRPPAEAISHLDAALVRDTALRWVPPDRWHITLEFVGDGDVAATLDRWTQRVASHPPLQMRLEGAGAFPRPARGRVLWVGIGGDADALRQLAAEDQDPHLTVARSRSASNLRALIAANAAYTGPSWTVDDVLLFDSRLGAAADHGPTYTVAGRLPLTGRRSTRR